MIHSNAFLKSDSSVRLIELFKQATGEELFNALFTTRKRWASEIYYAYAESKSGKRIEDSSANWLATYLLESLRSYLFDIEELRKVDVERKINLLFEKVDFSECFKEIDCKACGSTIRYKNLYFYINKFECKHLPDTIECCHCSHYQELQSFYIFNIQKRILENASVDKFLTRKSVWYLKGPFCYLCGVITYFEKPNRMHWKTAKPQMAEVDHIYPLAKGGGHTIENVAIACASCNKEKSDSIISY